MVKAEHESGKKIEIGSELEWVLPAHLTENWSLAKFAAVFDAISIVPPTPVGFEEDISSSEELVGQRWRGDNRPKRMLLATMHDDSTVVYYVLHDGIVKPRQN